MRILMLSQFFYPPTVGGEERHVADLCIELVARGHDVAVVTFWLEGFPEFEINKGVRIHRVRSSMQRMSMLFTENNRQYAPPFPDPEVLLALRRIILEEDPDIVHAHNWIVHSLTPLKAWSKAKFVMSLHDYSLVCVQKRLMRHGVLCSGPALTKCLECGTHFYGVTKGPLTALSNFFWKGVEKRVVDMFLPVSQAVVEGTQLDKHNVPYKIIPNFIPDYIEKTSDVANSLLAQLPKGDFLLFVGDITVDKGAEVLLQACAEMNTQIPLVLIGRPFLTGLAERLPANVFLFGPWPHDAIMGAWGRCTLGIAPSIWHDPCPTVAMEAMIMGRPVIAARSGGLTDIVIDGETGRLVTPGDPQALREAIQSLLDDPTRRTYMGMMAKQRVIEFQAKSVVSHIEQIYQKLREEDSTSTHALAQAESR